MSKCCRNWPSCSCSYQCCSSWPACNCNPSAAQPYYTESCVQQSQEHGICYTACQYTTILSISNTWAVPVAEAILTLQLSGPVSVLIGATIWNPDYGEYEIVSQGDQSIKVIKADGNTTEEGTVIPACTKFIISRPFTEDLYVLQQEIDALTALIEAIDAIVVDLNSDYLRLDGGNIGSLASNIIPFSNIAQIGTDRLVGRDSAGTGNLEQILVTGGLGFSGFGELEIQTGGVTETKILDTAVTYLKLDTDLRTFVSLGWLARSETFSYASANTITVSDSSPFQKGDRLWAQNSGNKFWIVVEISGAVLTVLGDVVDNSLIQTVYSSRLSKPFNFPYWFDHTPVYTGFSVDPSTPCRYRIIGNELRLVHGAGTGTSNDTIFEISLPVAAATIAGMSWGAVPSSVVDNGAALAAAATAAILSGGTTLILSPNITGVTTAWTNANAKGARVDIAYEF